MESAWFWVLLTIFHSFVCGYFSWMLAYEKGYDNDAKKRIGHKLRREEDWPLLPKWFLIGFFFGIFALIVAAGLPDRRAHPCDNENTRPE